MSTHKPRVLVLHNRYRASGGEERSVAEIVALLQTAGHAVELLERSSEELSNGSGKLRAGAALLRGGSAADEVAQRVASFGADVVHVHNMLPLFGVRALQAARRSGARVVMHLHNYRLFCSIAIGYREGAVCTRCHGRNTAAAVRLNCRESLAESAAYAGSLALHQPSVFEAVDRFLIPSDAARTRLIELGLPATNTQVLPNFLGPDEPVERSRAADGRYALSVGRLVSEKGVDLAITACAAADIPLKIAGSGPEEYALRELSDRTGAEVEFLGQIGQTELVELRSRAAFALMPSRWHEPCPYSALESAAAGLPTLASDFGGLPEIVGDELVVDSLEVDRWATAIAGLWHDPQRRAELGQRALGRVRERFGADHFYTGLMQSYGVTL